MNIIKISSLDQLNQMFDESLCLSGLQSEEIYNNMWCISLDYDFLENINIEQLKIFLDNLIKNREQQLQHINFQQNAIFYMWLDEQALQLRFNIISGDTRSLPFGCKIHIIDTFEPILNNFISAVKNFVQYGDGIEFFDENEIDDCDEEEDENEYEYVLDVFVKKLKKTKEAH